MQPSYSIPHQGVKGLWLKNICNPTLLPKSCRHKWGNNMQHCVLTLLLTRPGGLSVWMLGGKSTFGGSKRTRCYGPDSQTWPIHSAAFQYGKQLLSFHVPWATLDLAEDVSTHSHKCGAPTLETQTDSKEQNRKWNLITQPHKHQRLSWSTVQTPTNF